MFVIQYFENIYDQKGKQLGWHGPLFGGKYATPIAAFAVLKEMAKKAYGSAKKVNSKFLMSIHDKVRGIEISFPNGEKIFWYGEVLTTEEWEAW